MVPSLIKLFDNTKDKVFFYFINLPLAFDNILSRYMKSFLDCVFKNVLSSTNLIEVS